MDKVYIVASTHGDYEDIQTTVLGVFTDRDVAEEAVNKLVSEHSKKYYDTEVLLGITEFELNKVVYNLSDLANNKAIDLIAPWSEYKLYKALL